MRPPIARKQIVDLPSEDVSIDAFSVFETGKDTVRAAVQASDEFLSVGKYFVADISMTRESGINVILSDEEFLMFYQHTADQDIAVETGNVVRRSSDGWRKDLQGSDYLQGGYIVDRDTDYVFGENGELYFRRGENSVKLEVPTSNTLSVMHGTAPDSLYVAGENGTLLHIDNDRFRQLDVGIGLNIRAVHATKDSVYLGFDRATVGRLQNDEFVLFENELEEDVLSICEHRGQVYVADSDYGISIVKNDVVEPFAETGYVFQMNSGSDFLTCTTGDHILQFDGESWRGLEVYFEDGLRTRFADMSILE